MVQIKVKKTEFKEETKMKCKNCGNERKRRHQYCSLCAKKARLKSRREWRRKVKKEVLSEYSTQNNPICNWGSCGETDIEKLCLDHVNGGGREHMKSIGLYNPKSNKILGGHPFYVWLRKHGYPIDPPLQVLCLQHNQDKQKLNKEH